MAPEDLWSMARTALFFDLSVPTLYAQRTRNQMPGALGISVGRYVRFRPEDIERWLDEQRDSK